MHALTKVFVVFAAFLCAALSVFTIAYAVNTDKVTADYRRMQAQQQATEAQMRDSAAQASTEKANLVSRLQDSENAIAALNLQLNSLQNERAALLTDKNAAEMARQSIESKIAELSETAKVQATIIESMRSENSTLRQNELTFRERELQITDRLSELETQNEVLNQRYRAILEQFTELKRQADATTSGVTAAAGAISQPYDYRGPTIKGTIDEVTTDAATKKQMVRINVGANDRVAKNMKFLVVRNGGFLCNLVVVQTDLKWSLAEVQTLGKDVTVQVGDQVLSRAE